MHHARSSACRCLRPPSHNVEGFSLVELLTVVGIILIGLAAAVPAWRGMDRSAARHAAVRMLMGACDQTRAAAISEGRATYLVVCLPATVPVRPEARARSYAIFQDSDDGNFRPVQRSAWQTLPAGVSFQIVAGTDDMTASLLNRPLSGSDPKFPLSAAILAPGTAGAPDEPLPYLKFDSTGAVDEQDGRYLRLLLCDSAMPTVPRSAGMTSQRLSNGASAQKFALDEIDINPGTGRAKYIANAAENLSAPSASPMP